MAKVWRTQFVFPNVWSMSSQNTEPRGLYLQCGSPVNGYLSENVKMDQVVFECRGAASSRACDQSCSSAGREPLQQRAQGDDDDHDACDDEFSSCGQLDPSAEKEGERGRGISQRRNGKMDP